MICPKCGHEAEGNFCSHCGAPLLAYNRNESDGNGIREEMDLGRGAGGVDEYEAALNRRLDAQRETWRLEERKPSEKKQSGKAAGRSSGEKETKTEAKAAQKERRRLEERLSALEAEKGRREQEDLRQAKEERRRAREDQRRAKEEYGQEKRMGRRENRQNREEDARERLSPRRETERTDADEAVEELRKREEQRSAREAREQAADGIMGIVVLLSRVMQLACFLLMAGMVWAGARSFWYGRDGLGSVKTMISDENLGLALYLAFAGISLALGILWCLWILSRKDGGGGVRLKKYDTGRGLLPFLLCLAAVLAAGPASVLLPEGGEAFGGLLKGAAAILEAINANHDYFVFSCGAGAILSLIRRLLRV